MKKLITLCLLFSIHFHYTYASTKPGSHWFSGTVEEAMNSAKKANKPLFLYWGAVWCPPCNQVKKTIFSSPLFQKEAKNFVSVYLDGDKPEAQKWSDHFGTVGYPTLMVLNPAGEEIIRLNGALPVGEFVDVMIKTRNNQRSIAELYEQVKNNKATLDDYQRLAGYSWEQDSRNQEGILSPANKVETYLTLFNHSPENQPAIRAQFFLRYHLAKMEADEKYETTTQDAAEFEKILKDNISLKGNISLITYYPKEYEKLFSTSLGEKKFKSQYFEAMTKIRNDEKVDLNDRLYSFYPEVVLNEKHSDQLKKEVKQWVVKVDKESTGTYARQSDITGAIGLLKMIGELEEAKKLAIKELKVSVSPYYIMRYLYGIELALKNETEALKWSKKAWQESVGNATRFEWGSKYLQNLLKLDPKAEKEITATTVSVFGELMGHKDAFKGRNKKRLVSLMKSFEPWKKDHKDAFYGLHAKLNNNCKTAVTKDITKDCLGWVKRL